jgi:hypothetical protein
MGACALALARRLGEAARIAGACSVVAARILGWRGGALWP